MKNSSRMIALSLLSFVGVAALFGGGSLLADPSGQQIQLPLEFLRGSPFNDYLIPGIILFTVIGLGSLIAALWTLGRFKSAPVLVMAEGSALGLWIVVQILIIRETHVFQAVMGAIGLTLLALGWDLLRQRRVKNGESR